MTEPLTLTQALAALSPAPRLVVLMCGVAGSGKTSFSQALEAKGFRRLSIDEEIWDRFGRYGVDYRPEDYARHVAAARSAIRDQLAARLTAGQDALVVDSSFWSRAHRDDFKHLVETAADLSGRARGCVARAPGRAQPPLRRQRRPAHRRAATSGVP